MNNDKFDITDIYPKLYTAKQGIVNIIEVPTLRILAINGKGDKESDDFKLSVEALHAVAYALLSLPKNGVQIDGFVDYKISPLEVLWSMQNGQAFNTSNIESALWEAFLVVPGFVTQKLVNMAISGLQDIRPNVKYAELHISSLQEKKSAQTLHIGSYKTLSRDLQKLYKSIARRKYKPSARYHEIYLSEPINSAKARSKIIIRQPVLRLSL